MGKPIRSAGLALAESTVVIVASGIELRAGPRLLLGGASFRIVPGDGTNPFSCSLGDASFDCPQRLADTIDERPGADAVFTVQATADGRSSDSRHGSGRQDATVDCSGTACSLAGVPFPCTFSVDFVIVAQ